MEGVWLMDKYKFFDRKKRKIIKNLEEYEFFFNKGKRYVKGVFDTKLLKGILRRDLYKEVSQYRKCVAIHHVPCYIEEGKMIGDQYAFHNIYCFYNEDIYINSAIGLLDIEKNYNDDGFTCSFQFEGLDCLVQTNEFRFNNKKEFDCENIVMRTYYSDFFKERRQDICYHSTKYWYCYVTSVEDDGNTCEVKLNIVHKQKVIATATVYVGLNERKIDITELQNTIAEEEAPFIAHYIEFLLFAYQKKEKATLTIKQPF